MKKAALAIRAKLADTRQLEPVIDVGILAALVSTVLLISLLLSTIQLGGAQSPIGLAHAMAVSQTTTAHTAPGYLTPVLLLVGVMAMFFCAYYIMIRKPD